MIFQPTIWTKQPQIVVGPSGLRAARMVTLINPGAFAGDQIAKTFLAANGTAARSVGIGGRALETTAASGSKWEVSGSAWTASTTDFTLEVLITMTSRASLSCIFNIGPQDTNQVGNTGARRALLSFNGASNDQIYFWGNSADLASGVAWRTDGSIQHVFCTATGGTMRFYRDGGEIGSGTTPTLAALPATTFLTVGGRHGGGSVSPAMKLYKASFRNYALTAAEIQALTVNPWLDFAPIQQRIFVSVAAGGFTSGNASSIGASTTIASGSSIASASMSAAGAASASLVTATLSASVLSAAGASTGVLVGQEVTSGGTVSTANLSAAGAATATAGAASLASSSLSANGAATATMAGGAILGAAVSATGTSTATAVGSDANSSTTPTRYDGWLPRAVIDLERRRKRNRTLVALVAVIDAERRAA